jgi:hypothetical protein
MSLVAPVSGNATEGSVPNRQTDMSVSNGRRIITCAQIRFSRRIVHPGSWNLKRARQHRAQRGQSQISKRYSTHFMSNLGTKTLTLLRHGGHGIPKNQTPIGLEWQSISFKR